MELLDHMVVLFLIFWETSIQFSMVAAPIEHEDSFSPHPHQHIISQLFYNSHFNRCKVIISLWFWFAFPWWVMWSIFSCSCWPSICLLWKNVCSDPLPIFLIRLFAGLCYWIIWVLDIFGVLTPYQVYDLQIFSPIQ